MVPIYETDLSRERTRPSEWDDYEFWEKVEAREKKKQRLYVLLTLMVSLVLLSLPIWKESLPRWHALRAANEVSQLLAQMRLRATVERAPFVLKFDPAGALRYRITKVDACGAARTPGEYPSSLKMPATSDVRRLTTLEGDHLGVPGLIGEVCYDPTRGFVFDEGTQSVAGFAVGSANDLATGRVDRVSVVLLHSGSAEISFN
jgi:hypothetical protein